MVLPHRELGQPPGHGQRLVHLAELRERLDEIGRDGEGARVLHALALGVGPRPAQRLGGGLGLAREEPRDPEGTRGLEVVPANAGGLGARDRLGRPPPRLAGIPAAGGEQRAAALVHRPQEELVHGGLLPLAEEPFRFVPRADPELELAHVEALQRVGQRLAPLVGNRPQPAQRRARLARLASPHQPLAGDPLRRRGDVKGGVGDRPEPVAHVVDRTTGDAPGPAERLERHSLAVGAGVAHRRQRLERQRLGLGDALDADDRHVGGHQREHGGAQQLVAPALRQRLVEVAHDVVVGVDRPGGEQQARPHARRAGRKRLERRAQQIGQPLRLSRDLEVGGELEQALASVAVVRRRQAQGVLGELHRGLRSAARGGVGGGRRDASPPARRRAARPPARGGACAARSSETAPASARWSARRSVARAWLLAAAASSGCEARTWSPSTTRTPASTAASSDDGSASSTSRLTAEVRTERGGQEQPPHVGRERRHARSEEVLDRVGHRKLPAGRGQPGLHESAPDLQGEQRVAQRRVEDPPQKLPGQGQPEFAPAGGGVWRRG